MKSKLSLCKKALIAVVMMGTSAVANATLVTEWSFNLVSEFGTVGPDAPTFTGGGGAQNTQTDEISWGGGGGFLPGSPTINRSALTIGNSDALTGGNPATGTVMTNTGFGVGTNFTHWNNPIAAGFATLTGGQLFNTLTLTPSMPFVGPNLPPVSANFGFSFFETPNAGTCLAGDPNTGNCGDLWGVVNASDLQVFFSFMGENYIANILTVGLDDQGDPIASPIATLSDAQCGGLGLDSGCQGFLTAESQPTTVQFGFTVTAVPEPHILALFGLTALGIAVSRRRKFNK